MAVVLYAGLAAGCLLALTLTLFQSLLIGPSSEEPFPSAVTNAFER